MSCSKWFYKPELCDNQFCPGDCDLCDFPDRYADEESDGDCEAEDADVQSCE